jgi:predicted RNase H-like nuclease (RuvC/YqgF family)
MMGFILLWVAFICLITVSLINKLSKENKELKRRIAAKDKKIEILEDKVAELVTYRYRSNC